MTMLPLIVILLVQYSTAQLILHPNGALVPAEPHANEQARNHVIQAHLSRVLNADDLAELHQILAARSAYVQSQHAVNLPAPLQAKLMQLRAARQGYLAAVHRNGNSQEIAASAAAALAAEDAYKEEYYRSLSPQEKEGFEDLEDLVEELRPETSRGDGRQLLRRPSIR